MPSRYTTMALIYDFDGTLAPGNVQERQFLPEIGMKPAEFWKEVNELSSKHQADKILMYMQLMLKKADAKGVPVRLSDFRAQGKKVSLYMGIQEWFDRIDAYASANNIKIEHYVVSSGNSEIIEGTPIAGKFKAIYACRFIFDHHGVAEWPAQAINYTTKTQFLFRINKGAHDLSDETGVNKYVPKNERPVPFQNMIYFGDGSTDIPCFRLVKEEGGLSIAVFQPRTKRAREKAVQLLKDGRVHKITPADYREGTELDRLVKAQIDYVAAREARTRQMTPV